jgi:hypothetical protein
MSIGWEDAEAGPETAFDIQPQLKRPSRQSNQSKVRVTAFFQYL